MRFLIFLTCFLSITFAIWTGVGFVLWDATWFNPGAWSMDDRGTALIVGVGIALASWFLTELASL